MYIYDSKFSSRLPLDRSLFFFCQIFIYSRVQALTGHDYSVNDQKHIVYVEFQFVQVRLEVRHVLQHRFTVRNVCGHILFF